MRRGSACDASRFQRKPCEGLFRSGNTARAPGHSAPGIRSLGAPLCRPRPKPTPTLSALHDSQGRHSTPATQACLPEYATVASDENEALSLPRSRVLLCAMSSAGATVVESRSYAGIMGALRGVPCFDDRVLDPLEKDLRDAELLWPSCREMARSGTPSRAISTAVGVSQLARGEAAPHACLGPGPAQVGFLDPHAGSPGPHSVRSAVRRGADDAPRARACPSAGDRCPAGPVPSTDVAVRFLTRRRAFVGQVRQGESCS